MSQAFYTFLLVVSLATGFEAKKWTDACGVTASCFATPKGCLDKDNCVAVVSVAKHSDGNAYDFEMEGVGGVYVAVGVSKDSSMGDASVVECVHDADEGKVELFTSYNSPGGHVNTRIPTVDGVDLVNGSFVDGRVRCSFTRSTNTDVLGNVFDLNNNEYHLLLAVGSRVTSTPPAKLAYHDVIRASSSEPRNLGEIGTFA